MLIYEIQGERFPAEPEKEAKRKALAHPTEAEVIVWDGDEIIDRMLLRDLFNESTD